MKPRLYILNGVWYASGILPSEWATHDPFVGWVGDDMARVLNEADKLYQKFMKPHLEKQEWKRQQKVFEILERYDIRFGQAIQ